MRSMAGIINGQMPPATRQRLEVFVPRIIGTNDEFDGVRVEVRVVPYSRKLPLGPLVTGGPHDQAPYWDKAVHFLDQLCDVGAEGRAWGIQEERLEKLGKAVEARQSDRRLRWKTAAGPLPFDFGFLPSDGTTANSG
jgi:hypothetical protein